MTWEELKEKAKELDNVEVISDYGAYILIYQQGNYFIKFSENGDIGVVDDLLIAESRTPEQMYQIMLALR